MTTHPRRAASDHGTNDTKMNPTSNLLEKTKTRDGEPAEDCGLASARTIAAAEDDAEQRFDTSGPSSASATILLTPRRRNCVISPRFPSVRPFYGIVQDIRARAPYYWSDWTDAWNYRVVPATLLIFFSK